MSGRMRYQRRGTVTTLAACSVFFVLAAESLSGQTPAITARPPAPALTESLHPPPELSLERCAGGRPERPAVIAAVLRAISLKDDRAASAALDAIEQPVQAAASAAPFDVVTQYDLAVVLAARSDREGGRRKIAAAVQLQSQAQRVIGLVPDHPGAHYLLARLYAAIRRLDGLTRFLASRVLGGKALLNLPWPQIQSLFEVAERGDPCEMEYHFELATVHREQRAQAQANAELQHVLQLPDRGDSRLVHMRRQAEAWLAAGKRPPQ